MDYEDRMVSLEEKIDYVLKLLEENSRQIAMKEYMKTKQAGRYGKESMRYNKEVDDEELVRRYIENGCSIPKQMAEEYLDKYNITYNGLRNRLKNLNVWRGRENK